VKPADRLRRIAGRSAGQLVWSGGASFAIVQQSTLLAL
jgi:hypothetical protein